MYKIAVKHVKDYAFKVKSSGYEFAIDAKGKEGITPPDTLLAGLASCIGVYVTKYSEGAKLGLENFEIIAEGEFSTDAPVRFKEVSITIDLKGAKLEERRANALMEFIKNCPVHNTLENKPEVKIRINDGDKG
ncbi:MAG: OsmC family protein [Candidatus Omnitrophica bacterium]|nr:OsmC family protein [Candidatus Omnitrophota bacterium]